MSLTSGMTTHYNIGAAGGIREDLEDKIWDLFADDTWALTNLAHVQASNTYHEWLKDSLAAAGSNTALEGNEATFATLSAPTRVGNYCQITFKSFLVSGTLEAVSKAGRATEAARQTVRKMRELKNDMEWAIVRNQASQAGDYASARVSAGMESWLHTNYVGGNLTGHTTPGFLSGIVAAPTDGSTVAATEGVFKSALAAAWAAGGDASTILVNASGKATIDGYTGIVTRNINMMQATSQQAKIIGAANVYVSSYGVHTVVLHRHVRGNVMLCIDPDYWSIAMLRNPFMEQLSKTGDGVKYQMISEWTLVCRNEAASAKVVGLP